MYKKTVRDKRTGKINSTQYIYISIFQLTCGLSVKREEAKVSVAVVDVVFGVVRFGGKGEAYCPR